MPTPNKQRVKKVKAWAVVMFDGDLPDMHHSKIGNFYHVCSDKKSADTFVKDCNKNSKELGSRSEPYWFTIPCTIIYPLPSTPKKVNRKKI